MPKDTRLLISSSGLLSNCHVGQALLRPNFAGRTDVCFWHKADIAAALNDVCFQG
jgi:hypothetical protein